MAGFRVDTELTADEIRKALSNPAKGYAERAPYREAFSALKQGDVLRITPSDETTQNKDGETVIAESNRAIKFRIIAAGKDLNLNIKYGDLANGDIGVWLDDGEPSDAPPKKRRNKKADAAAEVASTNGTADVESVSELVPA